MKPQKTSLAGKTYLVTGGSSGIGKATALELACRGAEVIIVSRDSRRGQVALHDLRNRSGNPSIHLHLADLSSLAEIRQLAETVNNHYPQIHALVNVAGSLFKKQRFTADGLEMNFALNYLSYFFLTNLLLDKLTANSLSYVVNVTSMAHWWGRIDFNDLQNQQRYNMFTAYGDAKLAIVLFTREMARRMTGKGVIVTCVHPGIVATHIVGKVLNLPIVYRITDAIFLTPEKAAETIVFLASSTQAAQFHSQYVVRKKTSWSSKASKNMQLAYHLWTTSERIIQEKNK